MTVCSKLLSFNPLFVVINILQLIYKEARSICKKIKGKAERIEISYKEFLLVLVAEILFIIIIIFLPEYILHD